MDETTISGIKEICDYYNIVSDSTSVNTIYLSQNGKRMSVTIDDEKTKEPRLTIHGYPDEKEIKKILSECGYLQTDKKGKTTVFTNGRKRCILTKDGKTILLNLDKTPHKAYN